MKPTLIYIHDGQLIEAAVAWPEFNDAVTIDLEKELQTYDSHGMGIIPNMIECVVSVPEGSEGSLRVLADEACGGMILCVSVRRRPGMWLDWWARMRQAVGTIGVAEHVRHDVCEIIAAREFKNALQSLQRCADLVRYDGIDTSAEAMRTEKVVSRAIEMLSSTGFVAPRKR